MWSGYDGYAVFATKRVADELGLATVASERPLAEHRAGDVLLPFADQLWNAADKRRRARQAYAEAMLPLPPDLVGKIDPKSSAWVHAWYEAGSNSEFFVRYGKVEEASTCWRVAQNADPQFDARNNYGLALAGMGQTEEAIDLLQQAVAANPRWAVARWNLGTGLLRNGNAQQAVAEWREAVQLDPSNADALARLAWLLAASPDVSLSNGAEAEKLVDQAIRAGGGQDPAVRRAMAMVSAETGQSPSPRGLIHRPEHDGPEPKPQIIRIPSVLPSRISYRRCGPWPRRLVPKIETA